MGNASSGELGENRDSLVYDWLLDRVDGKEATSERILVDSRGDQIVSPF